jgi:N-acetylglucosamine-6-phosphate deacetylase
MADVPLADAVKMITSTPARILAISGRKGSLATGKDADIVIFDSNIAISMTMINGRIVFEGS